MAVDASKSLLQEAVVASSQYVLEDVVLPELGIPKKGKIRTIYETPQSLLMIASDRVSAFDHVLDALIPFKGQILNQLSIWNFKNTQDIVPNALVAIQPDPNVLCQKKVTPLPVEFIVRGYMWGSMAAAYERGERIFCGVGYPEGLLRYEKFVEPIFTPTTKAPSGQHDENISMEEVEGLVGKEVAAKAKAYAFALFERGTELAKRGNFILIDTKYEFGIDEDGKLLVIDEVNTPDSSRLCDIEEWEIKYNEIKKRFGGSSFKDVTELLKAYPHLKVKEYSKQFVRDVLLEQGYQDSGASPKLTKAQVFECSLRYIQVYERITQEKWSFPDITLPPKKRLLHNLKSYNFIQGCCAVILGGSSSDNTHLTNIKSKLTKNNIPCIVRICSAHKQPQKLMDVLSYYNNSIEPLLFVCCAGGTDALSGTVSYHSLFPAVSCPPDGITNNSCLLNPPGSSNASIFNVDNVAKFALQVFSVTNDRYVETLQKQIDMKIKSLVEADCYPSP